MASVGTARETSGLAAIADTRPEEAGWKSTRSMNNRSPDAPSSARRPLSSVLAVESVAPSAASSGAMIRAIAATVNSDRVGARNTRPNGACTSVEPGSRARRRSLGGSARLRYRWGATSASTGCTRTARHTGYTLAATGMTNPSAAALRNSAGWNGVTQYGIGSWTRTSDITHQAIA